ncbi:hypothetical protein BCR24_07675 [Enterococcus ureilyticus]|uniref:Uncharacterized protein n=1 Tax=Enterococcus ureilyticus TaxID=1131292 RepID=A0A1E5H8Q3_9ENTE|nr:hypothetical protein [Enterococcus ureilyticus]MBM7687503.1 hypothetical protein [Enterococcus ureilyticus]OEG21337.1 hypothetical protein BCR24_07675 [Enterococcus ureilyticus]
MIKDKEYYTISEVLEKLNEHPNSDNNHRGDWLNYSRKTITEIVRNDYLITKEYQLNKKERLNVEDTSYMEVYGMTKKHIKTFPKYNGIYSSNSKAELYPKPQQIDGKEEKIERVGGKLVIINKRDDEEGMRPDGYLVKSGRPQFLLSYDYVYSLMLYLENKTYPSKQIYISIFTKNDILNKFQKENMKYLAIFEVLEILEEKIAQDLKGNIDALTMEIARLEIVCSFINNNKIEAISTINVDKLYDMIDEIKQPIVFFVKTKKILDRIRKILKSETNCENEKIAQQLYEFQKYQLKKYENYIVKKRNGLYQKSSLIRIKYSETLSTVITEQVDYDVQKELIYEMNKLDIRFFNQKNA